MHGGAKIPSNLCAISGLCLKVHETLYLIVVGVMALLRTLSLTSYELPQSEQTAARP